MSVELRLSGFFFLFIIITNILSNVFGYQTSNDYTPMDLAYLKAKLQKISSNPMKFKISFALILIEHVSIILLAVMLFIAFSSFNMILGIVWVIFRIGESSIQIYNKKNYWKLLDIAKKYSSSSDNKKKILIDLCRNILKSKNSNFSIAQILFSIGTLAYSILFVTIGIVPDIIGWFGIVAGIIYCFGNGITLVKPKFKGIWDIGGLLILLFEMVLGGWLLFFL